MTWYRSPVSPGRLVYANMPHPVPEVLQSGAVSQPKSIFANLVFFPRPPAIKGRNGESTIYKWVFPLKPMFFAFFHCHKSQRTCGNFLHLASPGSQETPKSRRIVRSQDHRPDGATENLDVFWKWTSAAYVKLPESNDGWWRLVMVNDG